MFTLAPKDRYSPIVSKLNLFTVFYLPVLSFIIYLTDNHFKLAKFENFAIVSVLAGLEITKYYFFKKAISDQDAKIKQKKFSKLERVWKVVTFNLQMLSLIYIVIVLLGAQLFNKFQETFMLSVLLMSLAILPVVLYIEVDDIFQLLGIITMAPVNSYFNMFVLQLKTTLIGAWLGAAVIPLDWNRNWQTWPNSCIYGSLLGFYVSNAYFYAVHSTNILVKNKKNQKFRNIL